MLRKKLVLNCLLIIGIILSVGCQSASATSKAKTVALEEYPKYYFPHEGIEHEGTWLQWPHDYTYKGTKEAYEYIWIEMTRGLVKGENVHLIVYNEKEKQHVKRVLEKENIDMSKMDFYVFPTDDVWIRDNGPIFVYNEEGELVIENWEFNGWGNKAPFKKDNLIPTKISEATGVSKIDIEMVMEGGALEVDGNGTMISTLSCVNNDNRTPNFTIEEIEAYLSKYYGVINFIWLNGVAGEDITDNHIDGMIKFLDDKIIIADSQFDLDVNDLEDDDDAKKLLTAKNINGEPYEFVFLPETKKKVVKVDGEWIKGAYMNFYVANKVVLVPNYNDENDSIANEILQGLYPDKEIIGIDVRELYADGGMIHCVTQQQPVSKRK
ncbi:agmatine deiminase family protein [Oceanirhabdus sp. W0125-5]|uniref:agmatine deiminase family protein n=1 Tax=Oceanirhabdus sp. W0125-5 TaxID=2999116 RepID=UPI0022F3387B|nr:agmatine deiminase family protein [Oceanirhabdus sp. W0125-5]WBW96361.1 agmatine deiminase family protein [Oceanirhabdus sp. W0125-5]